MAGRWSDEYQGREEDRRFREDQDRSYGRGGGPEAYSRRESRSWDEQDHDRVFGERDYGAGYNRSTPPGRGDWQDRRYGGASPAMRQDEYEAGYGYRGGARRAGAQDGTRGGRYYGDDGRRALYRDEYQSGGPAYGDVPRTYEEGSRFGSREADARWSREMRRPVSGGTGGYDYERGYGDAGRDEDHEGFEERAREAGEFFRRTGRRVAEWFSGDENDGRSSHRGRGPKGYQRPDERISDEAHHCLTEDSWLDASDIAVSVSAGEVTLSGTVENRESKHRAERLVEDIGGVKHVQNNLRVDRGNFFTRPMSGYGDSAQNAALAGNDQVRAATDGDNKSAKRN